MAYVILIALLCATVLGDTSPISPAPTMAVPAASSTLGDLVQELRNVADDYDASANLLASLDFEERMQMVQIHSNSTGADLRSEFPEDSLEGRVIRYLLTSRAELHADVLHGILSHTSIDRIQMGQLVVYLSMLPNDLRQAIESQYQTKYGDSLEGAIRDQFDSSVGIAFIFGSKIVYKLLASLVQGGRENETALDVARAENLAYLIHENRNKMWFLRDEELLVETFTKRSPGELLHVLRSYERRFHDSVFEALRNQYSEPEVDVFWKIYIVAESPEMVMSDTILASIKLRKYDEAARMIIANSEETQMNQLSRPQQCYSRLCKSIEQNYGMVANGLVKLLTAFEEASD